MLHFYYYYYYYYHYHYYYYRAGPRLQAGRGHTRLRQGGVEWPP